MVEIRYYLNKKGQGIVEYALLLAFVVGIAMMLNGTNLGSSVKGVFDDVALVLGGKSENKYAAAFDKWGTMDYDKLLTESKSARIAADIEALNNIANYFNSLDMSFTELAGNSRDTSNYLGERWANHADLGNNPDKNVDGNVVLQYWAAADDSNYLSKTRSSAAVDWMKQNYDTNIDKSYTGNWGGETKSERYFFSDEMNTYTGSGEKLVKVAFTKDSSGNVTGTKVWVTQYYNAQPRSYQTQMSATDENGNSTIYSVYVPKSK